MGKQSIGILGDSFVGKSHITHLLSNKLDVPYIAHVTIGCYISKYIMDNVTYSLCDIFPQLGFINNGLKWISTMNLFILICDASKPSTINTILDMYNLIKPEKYAIFINKSDLVDDIERAVFLQKIESIFQNYLTIEFTSTHDVDDVVLKFNRILQMSQS